MFLELLATFSALTKILFGIRSPLHIDAEALYKIAQKGHTKHQLTALRAHHPDWFAHVLWAVTTSTRDYFEAGLQMDQLDLGDRLPRPLHHLFASIITFNKIENGHTPTAMKPPFGAVAPPAPYNAPAPTHQPAPVAHAQPQPQAYGKRQPAPDLENPYKRQKVAQQSPRISHLPDTLYKLQQTLLRKVPGTPLSQVLRAGGHNITALIKATGVPKDTCCRLLFWGRCTEATCHLLHDPVTLSSDATDQAVALLQPGATKLAEPAPNQN